MGCRRGRHTRRVAVGSSGATDVHREDWNEPTRVWLLKFRSECYLVLGERAIVKKLMCAMIVALSAWFAGGVPAYAAPLDRQLAAAGTQVPFSNDVNAIPTLWALFNAQLIATGPSSLLQATNPSALGPGSFAEPGRGNNNFQMLGQIVQLDVPNVDRPIYGIYDRLAFVPAARVLYFDSLEQTPFVVGPDLARSGFLSDLVGGDTTAGGAAGIGALGALDAPEPFVVIPEPATFALLGTGAAIMGYRKRQRRNNKAA